MGDVYHYKEFDTWIYSIAFAPMADKLSHSQECIHIRDRNQEGLGVSMSLSVDLKSPGIFKHWFQTGHLISHDGELIVFLVDKTFRFYNVATGN